MQSYSFLFAHLSGNIKLSSTQCMTTALQAQIDKPQLMHYGYGY